MLNLPRLQKLKETIAYLRDEDELPHGLGFQLGFWQCIDADDWEGNACDTVACLGGWYVLRHPEEGLTFGTTLAMPEQGSGLERNGIVPVGVDAAVNSTSVHVLAAHFGMAYSDAHQLFMPDVYQAQLCVDCEQVSRRDAAMIAWETLNDIMEAG